MVCTGDTEISLHIRVPENRGGGYSDQPKLKVPRSVQICILGGGGGPVQLKSKVPRSVQICVFGGGGMGGPYQHSEILELGH